VGGVRLIASEVDEATPRELRGMIDQLKQRIHSGVVLLATRHEGKAALAIGVTADLTERLAADVLVKEIAPVVGGSGGGRADFAQAGGSQPDKVPEALERVVALLSESLGAS
jgi:alanyl-tRNA synthetase